MAQDNSSKLSFTVEESVWLNKGQEIEEVISMSLNPDITIEERNDHVQIKGGLRLIGEYRPVRAMVEEMPNIDDLTFRSIEEVSQKQDGIGEVKHFFPIDVTIPLSRINNIQDVFVEVESFDYDLPDKSCIQLTADVVISGMNVEQKETTTRTEDLPILENDTSGSFEYEATIEMPKPPQINLEPPALETKQEERNEEHQLTAYVQEVLSNNEQEKEEDPQICAEKEEPQSVNEEETVQDEQQVEIELVRSEEQVEDTTSNEVVEEENGEESRNEEQSEERIELQEDRTETKVNIAPLKKISEQPIEEIVEVKEETVAQNEEEAAQATKPRKDENALYLTKMLSNGEEQFSKLRMCIIQPNESLDMIAERYNISSTQIIRMNRLDSDRIEEGQILYLPVEKNG